MFSLFSLVFYLLNKSWEYHNHIIYTCIFISKKMQNNPILICIVCFLVGPQDPALLCKPWDRLWTWMLGQHAGCFTTSLYIYISGIVKPTFSWVYQTVNNRLHLYQQPIIIQANTIGFIRPSTITHALISTQETTPFSELTVPQECLLLCRR